MTVIGICTRSSNVGTRLEKDLRYINWGRILFLYNFIVDKLFLRWISRCQPAEQRLPIQRHPCTDHDGRCCGAWEEAKCWSRSLSCYSDADEDWVSIHSGCSRVLTNYARDCQWNEADLQMICAFDRKMTSLPSRRSPCDGHHRRKSKPVGVDRRNRCASCGGDGDARTDDWARPWWYCHSHSSFVYHSKRNDHALKGIQKKWHQSRLSTKRWIMNRTKKMLFYLVQRSSVGSDRVRPRGQPKPSDHPRPSRARRKGYHSWLPYQSWPHPAGLCCC